MHVAAAWGAPGAALHPQGRGWCWPPPAGTAPTGCSTLPCTGPSNCVRGIGLDSMHAFYLLLVLRNPIEASAAAAGAHAISSDACDNGRAGSALLPCHTSHVLRNRPLWW